MYPKTKVSNTESDPANSVLNSKPAILATLTINTATAAPKLANCTFFFTLLFTGKFTTYKNTKTTNNNED